MSNLVDAIRAMQEVELTDLLTSLVRIPSVSGHEREIMNFVREYFETHQIDASILGRNQDRPNVVASIGTGNSPIVVLNGHLDTVPPALPNHWESDPFEAVVSDNQVTGLGSLDMKGSCAAMILALRILKEYMHQLQGTVQLQLVCDEEDTSHYGTPYLLELIRDGKLQKPDHVIVGEYTGLKIMTAERGSLKFLVHFYGHAAHTAMARVEGRNAIYAASLAIELFDRDLDIEHPEVGKAIVSVNQIKGGTHQSRVPDSCTIQVDRRLVPGETMENVLRQAQDELETLRSRVPWLKYEITPVLNERGMPIYVSPTVTMKDVASAKAIRKAHRYVTGKIAENFKDWFGATDAGCFRREGFDAINYGPDGLHAHGPNEFVYLDSLKTQLAVLTHAVTSLCGMKEPV